VLVIDDDTVSCHELEKALVGARIEHVVVGSGIAALAQVDRWQPSLVLLNLNMLGLDGYQVLRMLRARPAMRDVPVVVLTSLEADDEIANAFEAGADDFVRKPFNPVELIARVHCQFHLRSAMDALARREKDAKLVLELTQALASNLDFRSILFTVVQRIAEVVKVDRVSIVLVREQEQVGYVVAASDDEQLRDLVIDLAKYPEIQQVLTSGKPLVVKDAGTHPLMEIVRAAGRRRATFSTLGILPILYDARPMGVLFLRSRRAGAFCTRTLAACRTIASAMAIALRNARILQSLRDETHQVTAARVEAERRMKSLERYADFFNSSADGIVVIDQDSRLLFGNPKSREISGYGYGELYGHQLDEVVLDPTFAPKLRADFLDGHFPKEIDIRLRARDGRALIVNGSFASVLREEGLVLCSFRDVTQQREVEGELVKTKDSLRRVIDASVDGIVSCDVHGRVVLFNCAAERIFGCASVDVVGTDVRGLFPEGIPHRTMKMIRDGGGRVGGVALDLVDARGNRIPVLFSGAFIHEGDTLVGSVGVITDLREKMQMEQQQTPGQLLAQERQAIVAELAGAAAHELNQPLTSVLNYATLLRRLLEVGTPALAAAEVIESEADRMAGIVRKIGKITKYETKSYVGKQKILDLDRASEDADPDLQSDVLNVESAEPLVAASSRAKINAITVFAGGTRDERESP